VAMRRKRTPPDGVRSLGPVPQRRQAAISVDGAEPHHGEHAAELEQQEPPVSGLPQRAQETDLGVVDPGGDDTKTDLLISPTHPSAFGRSKARAKSRG